ncbi:MAG: glycoside hydrolase family 3 C-terminal domain-containing protein [Thermoflexales bacterium]|nr:glycoside hydrolase family 3 C-terminal domain-containing protein [Thermoflexales bacterium]
MDIEGLIAQLTLEEKVSLLAGADLWHTVPVERLGIPVLKLTDGPAGARGAESSTAPTSASFPPGVALGATWNTALVERVGAALGEETRAKSAHVLLAPTVNIHRSPLAGRNFECYSEDPYLSGCMAAAYIKGLQSQRVGACIKHFVCNDSEFERQTINSVVSSRALHEIYLAPFRLAIQRSHPWSLMSAYNKVNGVSCSENSYLLLELLKSEWGFDGLVMSDWAGTYSPNVAPAGLDLEMPGPARWMGQYALDAVTSGRLSQAALDDKVRRLLRTMERVGAFEQPELRPEQSIDKPEHRRLAREAGGEAIVLLKNAGAILPLGQLKSIAVIGSNARWPAVQGGGSIRVTPHYVVSPLEGIQAAAGSQIEVRYALGCPIYRATPLLDRNWLKAADGRPGFDVELYDNTDLSGEPAVRTFTPRADVALSNDFVAGVNPASFSVRLSATLTPPEGGAYTLSLAGNGLNRVLIDARLLIDNWSHQSNLDLPPWGLPEHKAEIELAAGQPYHLVVEYSWEGDNLWRSVRLGCWPRLPADPITEAAALAGQSDVAVVFAGLTDEWESEGYDRPDMRLPGKQAELIEQVAAANPNTIVVLNAGSPVQMEWLDKVAAVLQAWYLGQEGGNAVADVLFGRVNPSGKLPTTFPKRLQDNPAYINYPGENGQVHYGEGIWVGYRYYDKKDVEALFPFGHGLSYTTFAYRDLAIELGQDQVRVSLELQNTGSRAGQEVVQVYVRDVECSLARPEKELKAFAKVPLHAGQSKTVSFTLERDALSFYDDARRAWVAEAGAFEVLVGSSTRDIRLSGRFEWTGERLALHAGMTLKALLDDERGQAVLEKHLGALLSHPQIPRAMHYPLAYIARFAPQVLTPEMLAAIDADLAATPLSPLGRGQG